MHLLSSLGFNKRFQAAFLSTLLAAVVLFLATSSEAALRCEFVFRAGKNKVQTADLIDDQALVKAAISLRNRATQIDPVHSHVPELVLPVRQVANQIRLALVEKRSEKLYATRKPMLETVIREIEDRVAANQVTYEFSAVLPIRVGWLLKMSEKNPHPNLKNPRFNQPNPEVETSYYYFARTYQTHENFIAALEKVKQFTPKFQSSYRNRQPTMKDFLDALKDFPNRIFIPAFHQLSIPELNALMALKTFPLGNIRAAIGLSPLDGIFFDELNFPWHDFGHATGIEENPSNGTLTEKIVGPVERQSLEKVRLQREKRWDLWNVFHFLLFHEGIRYDYIDFTLNSLKQLYRDNVAHSFDNISRKKAEVEVFPGWFLALPQKQREELLKTESDLYLQMLEEQINANGNLIQSELDLIKKASGN